MIKYKVDDINKMIFHWPWAGYSGNYFFDGIMDCHPELLTIKEFGLSAYGLIYKEILSGKDIENGIRLIDYPQTDEQKALIEDEFDVLFRKSHFCTCDPIVPSRERFFDELREALEGKTVPSKLEWFKAMFLAYNYALGRTFNIPPAIFFNMHPMKVSVVECKKEMLDIYDQFEELKIVSVLRSQLSELGSVMQCEAKLHDEPFDFLKYVEIAINRTALYCSESDKWYKNRGVIRFEDLKLFPKETMISLCDFLGINYNDSMLRVTVNGVDNGYTYAGTNTLGWSIKPVYDLHANYIGSLDLYRLELLKGKYYEPWGYKAKLYNGKKYTFEEINKLYSLPFTCESFLSSKEQAELNKQGHERLESFLEYVHKNNLWEAVNGKNGKKPVIWLKPKVDDEELFH